MSERKNFCCLLSLVWGGMSGARQFHVHSAGFVLNYQSQWVSEVSSLMQEETVEPEWSQIINCQKEIFLFSRLSD